MKGYAIEPLFPEKTDGLEDLVIELSQYSSRLAAGFKTPTILGLSDLVRTMNCYYTNLIEGHPTLPRDIDAALNDHYSEDQTLRDYQIEAVQHIKVQRMIDRDEDPDLNPTDPEYIKWVHLEFCRELPSSMLSIENPKTGEISEIVPGEYRQEGVSVGRHIPPTYTQITDLMDHLNDGYSAARGVNSILAVAAAHHRLLWIHPFLDGNGRVARLISHAMFKRLDLGSGIWSVSRGMARNVETYKSTLAAADSPRRGDLDGRGSLSLDSLTKFCAFFLSACLDQVKFMEGLLSPKELGRRIELYARDEIDAGRLPKGSLELLREAHLVGEIEKNRLTDITGYQDRRARQIMADLVHKSLLVSTGTRKPLRLGFPPEVIERWFPALFPQ